MKITILAGMAMAAAMTVGMAQAQVKQDMKDAGHDTADATKTGYHKTANGTKKVYHKTGSGVAKVGDKMEGKPKPQ